VLVYSVYACVSAGAWNRHFEVQIDKRWRSVEWFPTESMTELLLSMRKDSTCRTKIICVNSITLFSYLLFTFALFMQISINVKSWFCLIDSLLIFICAFLSSYTIKIFSIWSRNSILRKFMCNHFFFRYFIFIRSFRFACKGIMHAKYRSLFLFRFSFHYYFLFFRKTRGCSFNSEQLTRRAIRLLRLEKSESDVSFGQCKQL